MFADLYMHCFRYGNHNFRQLLQITLSMRVQCFYVQCCFAAPVVLICNNGKIFCPHRREIGNHLCYQYGTADELFSVPLDRLSANNVVVLLLL